MTRLQTALNKKYESDAEVRVSLGKCWLAEGLSE